MTNLIQHPKLIKQYGGLTYSVPKKPDSELLAIFGDDAWEFCRIYGGDTLYIAKRCDEQIKNKHHAFCDAVLQDMNEGISKDKAIRRQAKIFDISSRWGQKLFNRYVYGTPTQFSIGTKKQLVFEW